MITQYDMATGETIATEEETFLVADIAPIQEPTTELGLQTVAEAIAIEQQAFKPHSALMQTPVDLLLK